MKVTVRLRKGDWAWIALAGGIALYEHRVEDDNDLLSRRAAAYRKRMPLTTTAVVLVTAAHLLELLRPERDPYARLVRYVRRRR
ncbi:DUF7427 family protein [Mycolicibacterium sp. XJ1819]